MSKSVVVAAAFALLTAAATHSYAVDIRSGTSVGIVQEAAVEDDIIAAGSQVTVQSTVNGDIVAAGQSVAVAGNVKDSAVLAGKTVTLSAAVGNDSWVAGQTVAITSSVNDNCYIAGSIATLSLDGSVGKDILAAGTTITLLGKVGRDVRAAGEEVIIGGTINRNVYVQAEKVTVTKNAVINGGFWYESPHAATIEPGARILGNTTRHLPASEKTKPVFWSPVNWVLGLIAAILFGAGLIAVYPQQMRGASETMRGSFLSSLVVGLAALIGVPIAALTAAITLVGIPIGLAALMIYAILLYAAWTLTGLAIGRWILGKGRTTPPKLLGSMILGLLILATVGLVPFVGWLVKYVAVIVGLGAFLVGWWRSRGSTLLENQSQPVPEPPQSN